MSCVPPEIRDRSPEPQNLRNNYLETVSLKKRPKVKWVPSLVAHW